MEPDFWFQASHVKSLEVVVPVLTRKKGEQSENQRLFLYSSDN